MKLDDRSLLHAYLDGELDAEKGREVELRLAQEPALRSAYEGLREMSSVIREKADYHRAPASLRHALPQTEAVQPKLQWLKPAAAFALAVIAGIGIALLFLKPADEAAGTREVVASHVRASLATRVVDVASSDQHAVKPWLSARLPFSPPVTDFSAQGYTLAGARLDYVAGGAAAVLVYKRREHVIDVFVAPGNQQHTSSAQNGFNVERFAHDGMRFWLVSDLNRNELDDFARLLGAGR